MDSGNRKDIEPDAGGSCRAGMYSTGATHTHSDSGNLQKTVVGCRSFILGPHLSFTFNSGSPKGWILLHGGKPLGIGGQMHPGAAGWDPGFADWCPLLPAAYLVQAVRAAGKCDAVFKGFSDCLLKLGDSVANYPQGLDDKTNIKTVCT